MFVKIEDFQKINILMSRIEISTEVFFPFFLRFFLLNKSVHTYLKYAVPFLVPLAYK